MDPRPDMKVDEANRKALLYESILSATADFNYSFDRQGRFSYINQALLSLLGITYDQAIGKNFHDLNYPVELATKLQAQIEEVFVTGKKLKDETPFTNPEGKWGYYEYIFVPIFDREGHVEAVAGSTRDISEHKQAQVALKASDGRLADLNRDLEARVAHRTEALEQAGRHIEDSLQEKVVLLKEIHHRVKNNLQIISSLLRMQAKKITHPEMLSILKESQDRIRSMALVHDLLNQSKDLRSIPFKMYLERLMAHIFSSYSPTQDLDFRVEGEELALDLDTAIPCGLIITELVTNACKHAFPAGHPGMVTVSVAQSVGQVILSVQDNGVGLPVDKAARDQTSMGLTIVSALTRQLEGTLRTSSEPKQGTLYTLTIPLPSAQPSATSTR